MLSRLQESVMRQNFEFAFAPASIPVAGFALGFIASIPATLAAAALTISHAVRAVFTSKAEHPYWTWSADCALIFGSQILNLCSLGLFNKIAVNYAERKWAEGTRDA